MNSMTGSPSGDVLADQARDDCPDLATSLQTLAHVDVAWPRRALRYVVTGEDPAILLDLPRVQGLAGLLLGKPGRMHGALTHSDSRHREIEAALKGRDQFYRRDDIPVELLHRLGKLLDAAEGGNWFESTGAPVPRGFHYLVNDALCASLNEHRPVATRQQRPMWTATLLHRLLELDDQPGTLALQMIFQRKVHYQYTRQALSLLRELPDLTDYLLTHADAVRALPGQLSEEGQVLLASSLGASPLTARAFADLLVQAAASPIKALRPEGVRQLESIPSDTRVDAIRQMLTRSEDNEQRKRAAELAGLCLGAAAREVLQNALAQEKGRSVKNAIQAALNQLTTATDDSDGNGTDGSADSAGTPPASAPTFETPVATLLGDDVLDLLRQNQQAVLVSLEQDAEREVERNRKNGWQHSHFRDSLAQQRQLDNEAIVTLLAKLNGQLEPTDVGKVQVDNALKRVLNWDMRLLVHPALGLHHRLRWSRMDPTHYRCDLWTDPRVQPWLAAQDMASLDLRAITEVLKQLQWPIDAVADCCLIWAHSPALTELPPERVWPFFAEFPTFIEEGLGLRARDARRTQAYRFDATLRVIDLFPRLLPTWIPRLMSVALGDDRHHRPLAQRSLARLPRVVERVVDALKAPTQDQRIIAAEWLADLRSAQALPGLRTALAAEKTEAVRAALLSALETLGEDLSAVLSPDALLAAARQGLKAKSPPGLAWLTMAALPPCHWRHDGARVPDEVVMWWITLACKLKDPAGNAMFDRYLDQLDEPSRHRLGRFVLEQFIAQDTQCPSIEQAEARATAGAPQRLRTYQQWASYEPRYADRTLDHAFSAIKREVLKEYLGSAIGEKGILALIGCTSGATLVSLLQAYMRQHYTRRSQIESMLMGAARSRDPEVIQLLLAVSRRHRTQTIQDRAGALILQIAELHRWSTEQLADRTVPTAGFDEQGRMSLDYGDREFTVVLDASLKATLRTADGDVIKALPEARLSDDAELVKDAKSQLSTSRKVLKQTVEQQTLRLYELMCTGRLWPVNEWRESIQRHPIMGRLAQKLIWQQVDPTGALPPSGFRPTEDGCLIDLDDATIELPYQAQIRLAHSVWMDGDATKAWLAHLKDFKLTPLFAQLTRPSPDRTSASEVLPAEGLRITNQQGRLCEAFVLRGACHKLGYHRGDDEGGGHFSRYEKAYATVGVRVFIEFTGNRLPEQNIEVALTCLSFEVQRPRARNERAPGLRDLPPALLAEAYADYLAVAKVCGGVDERWTRLGA